MVIWFGTVFRLSLRILFCLVALRVHSELECHAARDHMCIVVVDVELWKGQPSVNFLTTEPTLSLSETIQCV